MEAPVDLNDLIYAWKSYDEAIHELATGIGNIKGRLHCAHRAIVFVPDRFIPPDVLPDVKWIRSQLTRFQDEDGLVSVGLTLKKIRFKTAQKIAFKIYDVAAQLEDRLNAAEQSDSPDRTSPSWPIG